ncbi:MAG: glutathione peroxidase [Vagococcus sp.]|uniref:glutathione peroxidase n=1 Tax=Vagococcus TaxID=2737 RepID=UPI002FCAAE0F
MSIYQFSMEQMDGSKKDLIDYQGKVVLIVNTASKCGFTKQFSGLETLYNQYKDQGFVILGFPCSQFLNQELKTNDSILEFCQVNYGVTFPMFAKIKVRGKEKSPLYDYLIQETDNKSISWNFTKFLINQEGQVVNRFAPKIVPESIEDEIKKLLA